jgi:hypothetical protein
VPGGIGEHGVGLIKLGKPGGITVVRPLDEKSRKILRLMGMLTRVSHS